LDYSTDRAREAIDDAMGTATFSEKVRVLIGIDALPYFRWHPEYEVCITAPITGELVKCGVPRVSHTQLPSYYEGFQYNDHVRFSSRYEKKTRVVHVKLDDFINFLEPAR
jgi:hypothetical protein